MGHLINRRIQRRDSGWVTRLRRPLNRSICHARILDFRPFGAWGLNRQAHEGWEGGLPRNLGCWRDLSLIQFPGFAHWAQVVSHFWAWRLIFRSARIERAKDMLRPCRINIKRRQNEIFCPCALVRRILLNAYRLRRCWRR